MLVVECEDHICSSRYLNTGNRPENLRNWRGWKKGEELALFVRQSC